MQDLNKDDKFYELMQQSKLHLNSASFEDDIIFKIKMRAQYKKGIIKNIRLATVFFILTVIIGAVINPSLIDLASIHFYASYHYLFFQILLISAFLFLIQCLINLQKKQKDSQII